MSCPQPTPHRGGDGVPVDRFLPTHAVGNDDPLRSVSGHGSASDDRLCDDRVCSGRNPDVSAPPSPPASRLRAPRWLDGRLVAGIVLVLVSVVVGARLVAAAGATTRVYAAATDLALGSQLTAADVTTVRSRLFDSGHSYVDAAGPSPAVSYTHLTLPTIYSV